jgi:hypothetical protein
MELPVMFPPSKACYKPGRFGIAYSYRDNGNTLCCSLRSLSRWRAEDRDDINGNLHQRAGRCIQAIGYSFGLLVIKYNILTVYIVQFAQLLAKGIPDRGIIDDSDARNPPQGARAASGHANATPPKTAMKSRRLMTRPNLRTTA